MENALQIFESEEFGKIRTLVIDGVIYFVGKDVATALKYSNASKAIIMHVDDEDKIILTQKEFEKMASNQESPKMGISYSINDFFDNNAMGGVQRVTFINESGLYSLILSSKLPDAKKFKRWITNEVLPQIRKYGYYVSPKVEKEFETQKQPPEFSPETAIKAFKDIVTATQILSQYLGMPQRLAMMNATSVLEKAYGIEFDLLKNTPPVYEKKREQMLTPSQIGALTGKSAQYVNKRLCALGFQKKDFRGGYILTDKGREYGRLFTYRNDNGHKCYQIKWDYCIRYVI